MEWPVNMTGGKPREGIFLSPNEEGESQGKSNQWC